MQDVRIPEIGEGVESGKVVAILKQPGEAIEVEEGIIEVETHKAVVEIPSPVRGTVSAILVAEGDEVKIGDVVARVEVAAGAASSEAQSPETETAPAEDETGLNEETSGAKPAEETPAATEEMDAEDAGKTGGSPQEKRGREAAAEADATVSPETAPLPASPSVRRLARELGVDLRQMPHAGGGRISAETVKAFVRGGRPAAADEGGLPDPARWGDVSAEELSTVRRLTAESTARSWRIVPHVTQFDEADVTALEAFMDQHAATVRAAGGKLTVTAVLTAVCARALRRFPRFNAGIDLAGNRLVHRRYVHIGIAVDTPRGLLVPVVRDADSKTITQLAVEILDLADRARSRKVKPDELEGGSFTISNQGGIGGTGFTPIVLWPQAAILGVSRTRSLPRVVGDRMEARRILPLALSYDHRLLDGADAARFLRWVCDCLAQPLTMHLD